MFNRLYQATRVDELRAAARAWFERCLGFRVGADPRGTIGGFCFPPRVGHAEQGWGPDPALLTGACGTALALLAATTDIEPRWDRMLLVALPPVD